MRQAGATLHRGAQASHCRGLFLLRSTGSRRAGSVVVAHGHSCSAACEIFPDQGLNPCPLHWQADSQPLRHQGSPLDILLLISHITLCMISALLSILRLVLWPAYNLFLVVFLENMYILQILSVVIFKCQFRHIACKTMKLDPHTTYKN